MRYFILNIRIVVTLIFVAISAININATIKASQKSRVYCVAGDFNNWMLPNNESNNGAVILDMVTYNNGFQNYIGDIDLPKGNSKFCFYELDSDTYEVLSVGTNVTHELIMCDPSGSNDYPQEWKNYDRHFDIFQNEYIDFSISHRLVLSDNPNNVTPIEIKDWCGGEINIEYNIFSNVRFSSNKAEAYCPITDSNVIYAIVQYDDTPAQLKELKYFRADKYLTSVSAFGKKVSILFTTEKSLTPNIENVWGCPEETVMQYDEVHYMDAKTNWFPLVKGGKPFVGEFTKQGRFEVMADWPAGECSVSCFRPRNRSDITAEIVSDGITETRTLQVDPLTGFLPPVSVEGKNVSVSFSFYDYSLRRTIIRSHDSDPFYQLLTDERYPDYPYDKENDNGDEPYAATFKERGTMTVEYSPNYGICYCHYDGDLETSVSSAGVDDLNIENNESQFIDESDMTYYDLMGRIISVPPKGIYIIRQGNKFRKVCNN